MVHPLNHKQQPDEWEKELRLHMLIDIALTSFAVIITALSFFMQRKMRAQFREADSHWIGNILLGMENSFMVASTFVNTRSRVNTIRWIHTESSTRSPRPDLVELPKLIVGSNWHISILWTIKYAFLSTYFRVVPPNNIWARRALFCAMGVVCTTYFLCIAVLPMFCVPNPGKRCVSCSTIANISSHIALLIVPLTILRKLRYHNKLWPLIFVYIVGSISIIAALAHCGVLIKYVRHRDTQNQEASKARPWDLEVDTLEASEMWNAVIYISASIAFCLPGLRNLLRIRMTKVGQRTVNNENRVRETTPFSGTSGGTEVLASAT